MTANEAMAWLKDRVQYLIDHARQPAGPLGVVAYTPAAFGEGYKALYLRDFTYMAESAPEFVPAGDVRKILEVFVARVTAEGLCPERISEAGEAVYVCHGTRPAGDCAMFLVKLAGAYAAAGGDRTFVESVYPVLRRVLAAVPREGESGLAWIDPGAPSTGYGFTDTIAITGEHLFCSLLLREAELIVGKLGRGLGRAREAEEHEARAGKIAASLERLWSVEEGLYLAGSRDGQQGDVWGSAYACATGAVTGRKRDEVAGSLWEKRDRFLMRGQVRHLMTPGVWRKLIVEAEWSGPGKFQNGAYWGTAAGWVAEAFESARGGAGVALLCELVESFAKEGVWECVGPGGYERVANNVSSACLPYASLKRLMGVDRRAATRRAAGD